MTEERVRRETSAIHETAQLPITWTVRMVSHAFDAAVLRDRVGSGGPVPRTAPLVMSMAGSQDHLVVGEVLVVVTDDREVHLDLHVVGVWQVVDGRIDVVDDVAQVDVAGEFERTLFSALPPPPSSGEDAHHKAARFAKAVCELSRDSAIAIRHLRYALEQRLADESTGAAGEEHTSVVASMLKLNIVCGRATDVSTNAIREGLYSWITDDDAYHAYRRVRDRALLIDVEPATAQTRTWMRLHDAAIRQCEALTELLNNESLALVRLLAAASSISSSRDADAQTRLNTLVALLSIGIGVPALVLTMYSTELLLPLQTLRQRVAFLPIFLSLFIAAVLAIRLAPKGGARNIWIAAGIAVLLVLACLVVGAVIIVTHPLVS